MKNANKIVALVFNILIGALSIMAIVGYIVMPFWTISVGVKFNDKTKEAIMKIVNESLDGDSNNTSYVGDEVVSYGAPVLMAAKNSDSGSESGKNNDGDNGEKPTPDDKEMAKKIIEALLDNFANDKVNISVPVKLSTSAIFSSLTASDTDPVDNMIKSAVKESMDKKHLNKIIADVTESTSKAMVDVILDLLTEELSNQMDEEELKRFNKNMDDAGLTREYIRTEAQKLANALTSGKNGKNNNKPLTKDGFIDDYIIPLMEDIIPKVGKLEESMEGNSDFDIYEQVNKMIYKDMQETDKEYAGQNYFDANNKINSEGRNIIKKFLKEQAFDKIWKDTDKIKLDADTLEKLIQSAINGENPLDPDDNNENKTAKSYRLVGTASLAIGGYTAAVESTENEDVEETDDVADQVADNLTAQIDENTKGTIMTVMKVLAGLLIFSILVWVYQLVKVIVNTLTGKMRTKMKLSIWCGWYPFMFFALIPSIALLAFSNGWIPGLPAETASTLSLIKLTFNSSGMLAFIAAMAFIVIWIPYKIFAKKAQEE